MRQVIRSQKPRYLAGNKPNIKNALEITIGTDVGVMGPTGRIIKRASRKRYFDKRSRVIHKIVGPTRVPNRIERNAGL